MTVLYARPKIAWLVTFLFPIILILILFALFEENIRTLIFQLQNSIEQPWLIAMVIVLLLTLDVILPIPSSILSAFAVASLGVELGGITIWIGLTFGAAFGYFLGVRSHYLLKGKLLDEKSLKDAKKLSENIGFGTLVCLRAVPILAEISVVSAGLVSMSWWRFIVVVSLANLGVAVAYMYSVSQVESSSFWLAFSAGIAVPTLAWSLNKLFLLSNEKSNTKTVSTTFLNKKQLDVKFSIDYSYPVLFDESFFSKENTTIIDILKNNKQNINSVLVYLDSGLANTNKSIQEDIQNYFKKQEIKLLSNPIVIQGGERAKSKDQLELIYKEMLACSLDRHSCVIVIGGGALLDVIGYATSTFHRGIKLIRMPSTVLAQNDAGVGVKNGFNHLGSKNLIGTFDVPIAVLNDQTFLNTLSNRDKISGLAEAIKVALIRNGDFFDWIEKNCEALKSFDLDISTQAIKECAKAHLNQITSGDPFESGNSRPLDYGHWSAHWLEAQTNYELRHGEAVAIGMLLDSRYAVEMGWLDEKEFFRIHSVLEYLGFDLWHDCLVKKNSVGDFLLYKALEDFRQHLGGELCLSMLTSIGKDIEVNYINPHKLEQALSYLENRTK